jgi:rhamnosyl/mannosyltransferase
LTLPGAGIRVCHLGKYYHPATGGIENHVRTLALAQAELGCSVSVLCVNHRDRRGRDVTFHGLARTAGAVDHDGRVRVVRIGKLGSVARFDLLPGLRSALETAASQADLLHLHAPNPAMTIGLQLSRLRVPVVISHHSDIIRQRLLGALFSPFERRCYRGAARVLATSPRYIEGSRTLLGVRDRVEPMPLGLDLSPFLTPDEAARAYSRRLSADLPGPIWMTAGRMVYYKGLENAIRALREVPGTLLMVGSGPLKPTLEALADRLGVRERLRMPGRLSASELVGCFHAATAFWFPSNARSEGYGLVQVEAMASGCPVINTDIPASGVPWVCRHDESGLTIPVNDPSALAAAARRILNEPGLRSRLASEGRRQAVERFGVMTMALESIRHYRSAMVRP